MEQTSNRRSAGQYFLAFTAPRYPESVESVHTSRTISLTSVLNNITLFSHRYLRFPSDLFPPSFLIHAFMHISLPSCVLHVTSINPSKYSRGRLPEGLNQAALRIECSSQSPIRCPCRVVLVTCFKYGLFSDSVHFAF